MEKSYIIVNLGSSSKKYSIFSGEQELFSMYLEEASSNKKIYKNSVELFLKKIKNLGIEKISGIGFRVVSPTSYFAKNRKITLEYLKKLKAISEVAPLHIEPIIHEIEQWRKIYPNISFYGISDSEFHKTIPNHARLYALPKQLSKKYDIYRFGYHGISIASVINKIKKIYDGKLPENIIVCHLSGGSSITALKNGKSIDTSMGFTPLEGVPMVNRVGNIDAGAILYLLEKKIKLKNLRDILFDKSGMIGLTGITDMRKIVSLANKDDKNCLEAIDIFVYSIIKYIGAYLAVLENVDLLVFTGGIGEDVPFIRSLICENLNSLGIVLDIQKNKETVCSDGFIQQNKSKTKILVSKTQEMHQIFLEMKKLIF